MKKLKFKIGDKVDIQVNYMSELNPDQEYIRTGVIVDIEPNAELPYCIGEIDLWFYEDELKLL